MFLESAIAVEAHHTMIDASWQPRTLSINGKEVNYSFGDGNPPEVALSTEEQAMLPDVARKSPLFYTTYMTPEAEQAMRELLENPNFPQFLNKLKSEILESNMHYNVKDISMESILYVDPETGKKEFKNDFRAAMGDVFSYLRSQADRNRWKKYYSENDLWKLDKIELDFTKTMERYIVLARDDPNTPISYHLDTSNNIPPPGFKAYE